MTEKHQGSAGADATPTPISLHTERLVLRDFCRDDLEGVYAVVGDDEVTRWLSFDTRSHDEAAVMLDGILARQQAQPRTEYYLAVTLPDPQTTSETAGQEPVIGFIRLGLGGVKSADLGYAVRPSHQGRGIAREAVSAMLDFGFGTLGLHRVVANIGPMNNASSRMVEALGFQREGTIRDHVFTNGAWRDSNSYSLLEHEWHR